MLQNQARTLSWTPTEIVYISCDNDAITCVKHAQDTGKRIVVVTQFRWSWSTIIAQDTINLMVTSKHVKVSGNTIIADAGALVSALFINAGKVGKEMRAHGGCYTEHECQTVGGVLATNVHHSGVSTFGQECIWVDVCIAYKTPRIIRIYRDTESFAHVIGCAGRSGIILRAMFQLHNCSYYTTTTPLLRWRTTLKNEVNTFIDLFRDQIKFKRIAVLAVLPYWVSQTIIYNHVNVPLNPIDIPSGFGKKPFLWKTVLQPLNTIFSELPHSLYQIWKIGVLALAFSFFSKVPKRGDVSMDLACSQDFAVWCNHIAFEAFIPIKSVDEFFSWYDDIVVKQCNFINRSFIAFRYIYGATRSSDSIAFGITVYHKSSYSKYRDELEWLTRAIYEKFGRTITYHQGKFNPAPYTQYDHPKFRVLDPNFVFCKDSYSREHQTLRRYPPFFYIVILIGIVFFVILLLM